MTLPEYELTEKIAESRQATLFKAYHKKNPHRLLALKILKEVFLSDYKISQFNQKIEHLKSGT